ncbi:MULTISPECIES: chemotaxis protein [Roseobacteraceae]|uniref:chemotaxis protein n=1 Tax=Roseobacteraceae TaxID=2854170 RepID=UPI0013B5CA1B|nr:MULTISPECIES: chemotaxis protein [unclassified Salipiger]NDV48579.1 chemotaxis protein [Salipiger sp. PrR003]NDW30667.1 chemotaxis protein [Salipiger sp. PrR007]
MSTSRAVPITANEATWLLSREIRHLQQRLERLEHGMEHIYSGNADSRLGSVAITAFQELDMLAQSTDALAGYVERLARLLDTEAALDLRDALDVIPLRDLRQRLGGAQGDGLEPNAPELF